MGHSQRHIASILKIGLATVDKDLHYLRREAKVNISRYIDEYVPAECENCVDGLNNFLTEAWNMSTDKKCR
jgi:post-segregation antitoxin (ccd killing protein)